MKRVVVSILSRLFVADETVMTMIGGTCLRVIGGILRVSGSLRRRACRLRQATEKMMYHQSGISRWRRRHEPVAGPVGAVRATIVEIAARPA